MILKPYRSAKYPKLSWLVTNNRLAAGTSWTRSLIQRSSSFNFVTYAWALAAYVVAPSGSAVLSPSRIFSTYLITLLGSSQKCGSTFSPESPLAASIIRRSLPPAPARSLSTDGSKPRRHAQIRRRRLKYHYLLRLHTFSAEGACRPFFTGDSSEKLERPPWACYTNCARYALKAGPGPGTAQVCIISFSD